MKYSEFEEKYIIIETIHSSITTEILKVNNRFTQMTLVVKIIKNIKETYSKIFFTRETDALDKLNDYENIVHYYESFILDDKDLGCIILEFIDGINLQEALLRRVISNNDKYYLMLNILNAVNNAHKVNIIHRDIKPTNIMILDDNSIKIIDFGISKIKDSIRKEYFPTVRNWGNSIYQAPEARANVQNTYEKSDIYSLGALMYYLFSLNEPIFDPRLFIKQVEDDTIISIEIQQLILNMIIINPEERENLDAIITKLSTLLDINIRNTKNLLVSVTPENIITLKNKCLVTRNSDVNILKIQLVDDFIDGYGMYEANNNKYYLIGETIQFICTYNKTVQCYEISEIQNISSQSREILRQKSHKINCNIIFFNNITQVKDKDNSSNELSIRLQNHYMSSQEQEQENIIFRNSFNIWKDGLIEDIDNKKSNAIKFVYENYDIIGSEIKFYLDKKDFNYSIDEINEHLNTDIEFIYQQSNKKIILVGKYIDVYEEKDKICLVLEKSKHRLNIALGGTISVDYRKDISAMKKQMTALNDLNDYKNNNLKRLLVGLTKPDNFIKSKDLKYFNDKLDNSQRESVRKALCSSSITLIQGPPGTGKTSVIKEIIMQILLENKQNNIDNYNKILVVSQAHKAVDNVLSKIKDILPNGIKMIRIGNPARIMSDIRDNFSIETAVPIWIKNIKTNSELYITEYLNKFNINYTDICKYVEYKNKFLLDKKTNNKYILDFESKYNDEKFRKAINIFRLHYEWINNINKNADMEANYINSSAIVAGTCIGFKNDPTVANMKFNYVIIDEAAKASTPELLVSLLQCSKKIIMVGDQNQLPPMLTQGVEKKFKESNTSHDKSFFTTLYNTLDDTSKQILNKQYRMNPVIGTMISKVFYNNEIINGISEKDENHFIKKYHNKNIIWISTSKLANRYEKKNHLNSFQNYIEMRVILNELKDLDKEECINEYSIGIITPYSAQKDLVRMEIIKSNLKNIKISNIEINSVDSFQGSEKDIIIYSIVRSNTNGNLGFIKDKERANVAFSRAKKMIIIIGDLDFVNKREIDNNKFTNIIDYISSNTNHCQIIDCELGGNKND